MNATKLQCANSLELRSAFHLVVSAAYRPYFFLERNPAISDGGAWCCTRGPGKMGTASNTAHFNRAVLSRVPRKARGRGPTSRLSGTWVWAQDFIGDRGFLPHPPRSLLPPVHRRDGSRPSRFTPASTSAGGIRFSPVAAPTGVTSTRARASHPGSSPAATVTGQRYALAAWST